MQPSAQQITARRRLRIKVAVIFAAVLGVLVSAIAPSLIRIREFPRRALCASNEHAIGQAIDSWQNAHEIDRFPDKLEEILSEKISPEQFVCPSSNESPSSGPTTKQIGGDLSSPGHLSYIYIGKGLRNESPADCVVLFEPLANHKGEGMHVLFADLHVDWIDGNLGAKLIAAARAGHGLRLDVSNRSVKYVDP